MLQIKTFVGFPLAGYAAEDWTAEARQVEDSGRWGRG